MSNKYYLAPALVTLRSQINELFPGRDKTSDGWIGDAAHKSRKSDHNAWVRDKKNVGVVTALDVDKDLSLNVKVQFLVDQLLMHRDPRIKYIIFNGRITQLGADGRIKGWKPYTGTNAHREHFHISVKSDAKFWSDDKQWSIGINPLAIAPNPPSKQRRELKYQIPMLDGDDVRELQARLIELGYLESKQDDGVFGKKTRDAVVQFQRSNALKTDGRVGPKTLEKLNIGD